MYFCTRNKILLFNHKIMERILEKLRAKFAGVSDKILEKIAKKIAEKAKTDEEIDSEVEAVTISQLLEVYGDSRATDATKTAVLNYEKKYNLKDGEKQEGKSQQQQQQQQQVIDPDVPQWGSKLVETVSLLADKIKELTSDKLVSARKQQLNEKIKDLPESLRKVYDRVALDSMEDDAFTTFLQEVETEVKGIQNDVSAKGAVFGKPAAGVRQMQNGGGGGKEATDQEMNEVFQRLGL